MTASEWGDWLERAWDRLNGFLLAVAIIMALMLLAGCASVSEPYWTVTDPNYRAPIKVTRVASAAELSRICRRPHNDSGGCAIALDWACFVYLGPSADQCVWSHEVNGHCGGDGKGRKSHSPREGFTSDCGWPS